MSSPGESPSLIPDPTGIVMFAAYGLTCLAAVVVIGFITIQITGYKENWTHTLKNAALFIVIMGFLTKPWTRDILGRRVIRSARR